MTSLTRRRKKKPPLSSPPIISNLTERCSCIPGVCVCLVTVAMPDPYSLLILFCLPLCCPQQPVFRCCISWHIYIYKKNAWRKNSLSARHPACLLWLKDSKIPYSQSHLPFITFQCVAWHRMCHKKCYKKTEWVRCQRDSDLWNWRHSTRYTTFVCVYKSCLWRITFQGPEHHLRSLCIDPFAWSITICLHTLLWKWIWRSAKVVTWYKCLFFNCLHVLTWTSISGCFFLGGGECSISTCWPTCHWLSWDGRVTWHQ